MKQKELRVLAMNFKKNTWKQKISKSLIIKETDSHQIFTINWQL